MTCAIGCQEAALPGTALCWFHHEAASVLRLRLQESGALSLAILACCRFGPREPSDTDQQLALVLLHGLRASLDVGGRPWERATRLQWLRVVAAFLRREASDGPLPEDAWAALAGGASFDRSDGARVVAHWPAELLAP